MLPRLAVFLLLASCASPRSVAPLRISATHYQSMAGVRVGHGGEAMVCSRDTVTGSHILNWYCRFEADGPQYLLGVPVRFQVH